MYDQFYGYELTILRLEGSQGDAPHIVLRSEEKL